MNLVKLQEQTNLSPFQTFYWVGQKLRPDSPLFNTILSFTIHGPVDLELFQQAHDALVAKAEVLRTVVREKDGVPFRQVLEPWTGTVEVVDFSGRAEPEAAYQAWLEKRQITVLVMDSRLYDSAIIRLSSEKHIWYINQHHIHTDAASGNLVWRYLSQFYRLAKESRLEEGPDIPSYETFMELDKRWAARPVSKSAAAFWGQMGLSSPTPVFAALEQEERKGLGVRRHSLDLGEALSKDVFQAVNQKSFFLVSEEFSLTALFLSLLAVLLNEHAGIPNVGMMTASHNRVTPDLQSGLGLMMSLLPIVVQVSPGESFRDVYNRTRGRLRNAYSHPLPPGHAESQNSLFEVMFNFYTIPPLELDGSPVEYRFVHNGYGTETIALNVNRDAGSNRLVCHFDLHGEAFSDLEAKEFTRHFLTLVRLATAEPDFELVPGRLGSRLPADGVKGGPPRQAYFPPRDLVETELVHIWEQVLHVDRISITDSFYSLGGNSWNATRLFNAIGETLQVQLPLSTLLHSTTVESLADIIRKGDESNIWQETAVLKEGSRQPALFLVSGGAGNLLAISRLARRLKAPNALIGFEVPGFRDGDLTQIRTIEAAAESFLEAMRGHQPEGPYLLGGYSWGAVVAFEMARRLAAAGEAVPLLVNLDMPLQPPFNEKLSRLADRLARWSNWDAAKRDEIFMGLRDIAIANDFFWRCLSGLLLGIANPRGRARKARDLQRSVGGLWDSLRFLFNLEARRQDDFWTRFNLDERRLAIIRENDQALGRYIPSSYDGDLVILYTAQARKNPRMRSARPYLGWNTVVGGNIRMARLPGDHLSIMNEPGVQNLAFAVDQILLETNHMLDEIGQKE